MDEAAFRQAHKAIVARPCSFEKALLAACASCRLAQRHNIAEREAVACREAEAQARCAELHGLLRRHAAFALHLRQAGQPLTHAQEMKVQCGGLAGLQQALGGTRSPGDIAALAGAANGTEGGLDGLPWPVIIQSLAAWQLPRRRRQS